MVFPSKASHGCFGTVKGFSVGKFVGDASELLNVAEWNKVTKRNQNGKLSKLEEEEISNLKNWNMIPEEELISLEVAPKVNDHHDQKVHNRIMQRNRNAKMNQEKKKDMSLSEIEKSLKEIKQNETLLSKESHIIREGLKQAELSTKRCANLLLVQKRLHKNLLESKIERLPSYWNEFWMQYSNKSLPHCEENVQNHFKKTINKNIARIDNIRKHVGDMDIKIFHAIDIKNKWKTQETSQDLQDCNFDNDDEIYINHLSDSDEGFDDDDNWSRLDMQEPNERHRCRFIGRSRHKCLDMESIKSRNRINRQEYSKAAETIDKRKREKIHQRQFLPHEPCITSTGNSHEMITRLTETLKSLLDEQRKGQNQEGYYRTKLKFLKSQNKFDETYQILSKKLSDFITEGAWRNKEIIHLKKRIAKLRKGQGFSRIARAFMAFADDPSNENTTLIANVSSSIIQTNSGDSNEVNPDPAIPPLSSGNIDPIIPEEVDEFTFSNVSVDEDKIKLKKDMEQLQLKFQNLLQTLSEEREIRQKEQQFYDQERQNFMAESRELRTAVLTSNTNQDKFRNELQEFLQDQTQRINNLNESNNEKNMQISPPIQKLLTNYDTLDDDSKKNLFQMAMFSNNEVLQRELIELQQSKGKNSTSTQAKLAKELINLAETYKIPELTFDTKATKRRTNYFLWSSKLRPVLAMFSQTCKVFDEIDIKPFQDPEDVGNKALYLLISAKVDEYFQRAIKKFEGYGDKALAFIKTQCANINAEDTHHYHHIFTTMRIKDNESATNFFKRFTFAQTEAEAAGNT